MGAQAAPIIEDDLVQVYEIPATAASDHLTTTIQLGSNWDSSDSGRRWATSPATLRVESPYSQNAVLQINPAYIYDPQASNGIGSKGTLTIRMIGSKPISVTIEAGKIVTVPLQLTPGSQTITLWLKAGNFQPSKYGLPKTGTWSFAIHSINLQTQVP